MKWFFNLKIAAKLLSSFILIAIIAGIVGTVGIINIKKIDSLGKEMYERNTDTLDDLARISQSFERERGRLRDMIIQKNIEDRQTSINKLKDFDKLIDDNMTSFEKGIKDSHVRDSFNNLQKGLAEFRKIKEKVTSQISANQDEQAINTLYVEGRNIADTVQSNIDDLLNLKVDLAKQISDNNSAMANTAVMTMIAVIIGGMIIAILLGLFISRTISNPINKLVEAAEKLAVGDINVNINATTKDEVGDLMESFDKMVVNIREQAFAAEKIASGDLTIEVKVKSENDVLGKKLREMVEKNNEVLSNINTASEQVATGAKQVSASSQTLSQGSTEQASSIEEITASIEEISSQTIQNAANANKANELASNAKEKAVQGNMQMSEMLKSMGEINDSSNNISKIIKVIDEIAFQTNILALNAAVEAARAGQHGKGFAVVAEEVRNLAARSANAAKETTAMIEGSIKKVDTGTRIANDTAAALYQIVDGVTQVANLVGEIADASNEQASGIAQVNQAITQVAQVVQTNSATSEESAAASEELSSQAELLKDLVSKYKLNRNTTYKNSHPVLTPEILKMLEDIAMNNHSRQQEGVNSEAAPSKLKINLNDSDFGKY